MRLVRRPGRLGRPGEPSAYGVSRDRAVPDGVLIGRIVGGVVDKSVTTRCATSAAQRASQPLARAASWLRERAPSLVRALSRWKRTVASLMPSTAPMSRSDCP